MTEMPYLILCGSRAKLCNLQQLQCLFVKTSQARIIIIITNNLIAPLLQASKGALQLFTLSTNYLKIIITKLTVIKINK